MRLRVTYGLDKVAEGGYYHEAHIIRDLQALAEPATTLPLVGLPGTSVKGVDTEYSKEGELLTLGLASASLAEGMEWVLPSAKSIAKRSLRETDWLVGHNIPGDIDQLAKNGLPIKEDWYAGRKILDSFVLAKMADENKPKGSYGLEALTLTNYNVPPWKAETDAKLKETGDARDWTPQERESRCRMDAWATFMLAKKLYPEVANSQQAKLLVETIHRISMTLYRIGLAGAKVDREYLNKFKTGTACLVAELDQRLKSHATVFGWDKPEPFCPTKDDDIRHLLFDINKIKPVSRTAQGKPAVDKVSLKQFGMQFTDELLEYNRVQKLDSVYNDIDQYIDEAGFIHFWINQLGARTGRRSSGGGIEGTPSGKNGQNWPPDAKHMIVSRFPGGKIGAFDYQSLEPVLYAWLSKDANLFDFFYNGRGYLDICKRVLGQDIDKTSKIYRAIKNMTLGIFYNMQAPKMARNLWQILDFKFSEDWDEHLEETGKKRQQILKLFPRLTRYMEGQKIKLARDQQIVAPDGYIRHLPHHGEKSAKYWSLVNQAINFPVQHLASMVTGCAMIDCEARILEYYSIRYKDWQSDLREGDARRYTVPILVNEVHDELTWDLPANPSNDMEMILETMAFPPSLKKLIPDFDISLKIEPKIADRW